MKTGTTFKSTDSRLDRGFDADGSNRRIGSRQTQHQ